MPIDPRVAHVLPTKDTCRYGHPLVEGNLVWHTLYGTSHRGRKYATCLYCRRKTQRDWLRQTRRKVRRAARAALGVNG